MSRPDGDPVLHKAASLAALNWVAAEAAWFKEREKWKGICAERRDSCATEATFLRLVDEKHHAKVEAAKAAYDRALVAWWGTRAGKSHTDSFMEDYTP